MRPGNVLVAVRNPNRLQHLHRILGKTDTRKMDIVVLSVHNVTLAGAGEHALTQDQIFSSRNDRLQQSGRLAEKAGKHVELMVVPGLDPYDAVVQTAARLQSSRIVMGLSPKLSPSEQGRMSASNGSACPSHGPPSRSNWCWRTRRTSVFFNLGPHPPRLWPEDVELVHQLWLELSAKGSGAKLHHRDVVGVALRRMRQQLDSDAGDAVVGDVALEIKHSTPPPEDDGTPPAAGSEP